MPISMRMHACYTTVHILSLTFSFHCLFAKMMTYVCASSCESVYIYVRVCVCVSLCVCVYVCMRAYGHIDQTMTLDMAMKESRP